jgi:hypothetical protein
MALAKTVLPMTTAQTGRERNRSGGVTTLGAGDELQSAYGRLRKPIQNLNLNAYVVPRETIGSVGFTWNIHV